MTLLELGASPHAKSGAAECTALMNMVIHRQFSKAIARLLENSINDQDAQGCTALIHAVRGAGFFGSKQGNLSIANDLLSLGADPFIRDRLNRTAMDYANTGEMEDLLKRAMNKAE